jgi:hypothetical protein
MKTHLTERVVKTAAPDQSGRNIITRDDEVVGFGLRITPAGARAFVLSYRIAGRQRCITIGSWPDWSVAAAREEAKRLKRETDGGEDPLAKRVSAREAPIIRELIDRYLTEHAALLAKRTHENQASLFRNVVEPAWGARKVADIKPDDVDRLLRKIAGGIRRSHLLGPGKSKKSTRPTPIAANRAGAAIRKMFNLAIRWGMRSDNPAHGFARNPETPRDRYLSHEEIGRLTTVLADHPNQRTAGRYSLYSADGRTTRRSSRGTLGPV